MSFGHERLDAYRVVIEYVGWDRNMYRKLAIPIPTPTKSARKRIPTNHLI